ncbi:uncharacterized protein LOC131149141 [Malania oleifera]|uniref:uncharacterized protein LOC131149141 n=1 Tax=Malania oleifera TaxID=397392 RepID=UPI0025AE3369|nr:uncharacterized protein LOC131149141 [Malania oleifera]
MSTDTQDEEDDADPFPPLSPPQPLHQTTLTVPTASDDDGASNQHLQHHYIRSIELTVVIRQLPSQGIPFQLWPAATTLVSLLDLHRSDPSGSPLSAALLANRSRLRVLELGSGTGLVGIAAAAILGAAVTLTDLPHVLPNLQFNADANAESLTLHGGAVDVAPLRWGEESDAEAVGREFDLILCSDVVYHDHLYDPLLKTLRFLLGGEEKVVFVMAHLRRWKKESAFFRKAKKMFEVERIHEDGLPPPGSRVAVAVYRFAGKRHRSGLKNSDTVKAKNAFQN